MTIPLVVASCLLLLDQLTKFLIKTNFEFGQTQPIIENVLHLTYIHNQGAAFGILKDHRWVFLSITTLVIIVLVILLISRRIQSKLLVWASCLIISGGIGNMIDRVFVGYVVDFIDLRFINFYVFNVADCCVVIGAGLFILHYILDIKNDLKKRKEVETAD